MTDPSSSTALGLPAGVEIRVLDRPSEMAEVIEVLGRIWPSAVPFATVELLRSVSHVGGYVAGAYDDGDLVAASFGFPARHGGRPALHSHVTGVLDGVRHRGIGRQLKYHQRRWAADQGLELISWTFDPLVRRNAWFNLAVLGARISDYLVDFYGPMTDALNAGDDSDRLLVVWPTGVSPAMTTDTSTTNPGTTNPGTTDTGRTNPGTTDTGRTNPGTSDTSCTHSISTPEDIVELRRRDPSAAREWRVDVRRRFLDVIEAGGEIIGFSPAGEYLIDMSAARAHRNPSSRGMTEADEG